MEGWRLGRKGRGLVGRMEVGWAGRRLGEKGEGWVGNVEFR